MAVYFITGKLGSGKTLCTVGRLRDYIEKGKPVASNLDIDLGKLVGKRHSKARFVRIPDKPSIEDLHALGMGGNGVNEEDNGLIVLDECGTWFNSRTWNDKSRSAVIDWFLHSRKMGWDILFIVQNINVVDKQARNTLAEHVVYCRRTDRFQPPLIGSLYKTITGGTLKLPKVHMATVKYGDTEHAPVVDRWVYRGHEFYGAYNTAQIFRISYPHGPHSLLPPAYTVGRFSAVKNGAFFMRMTRIVWRRFSRPAMLFAGFVLGVSLALAYLVADRVTDMKADQVVDAVAEAVPDVSNTFDSFDAPAIVGYSRFGPTRTYRIVDGKESYTSADLIERGFTVRSHTSCHAEIVKDDQILDLRC